MGEIKFRLSSLTPHLQRFAGNDDGSVRPIDLVQPLPGLCGCEITSESILHHCQNQPDDCSTKRPSFDGSLNSCLPNCRILNRGVRSGTPDHSELAKFASEIGSLHSDMLRSLPSLRRKQPAVFKCGLAVLSVAVAVLLTNLLEHLMDTIPLFYAAVIISSWYGGRWSGLLAVLLAMLAVDYYFVPPFHQIHAEHRDDTLPGQFCAPGSDRQLSKHRAIPRRRIA